MTQVDPHDRAIIDILVAVTEMATLTGDLATKTVESQNVDVKELTDFLLANTKGLMIISAICRDLISELPGDNEQA